MNKFNRFLLAINLIFLCILFVLMFNSVKDKKKEPYVSSIPIVFNFDNDDLKKIDTFIDNFNQEKSDYLMLIPQPIDSGFVINDVYTDGETVTWTIDNSRDALSKTKTTTYECNKIDNEETIESYSILLSGCTDFDPNETLKILNIEKQDYTQFR